MGLSFNEVLERKERFEKAYFFTEPWIKYVNMCGISRVGIKEPDAPLQERDDYCISVGLISPLPPELSLPTTYEGVRICVQIIGPIVAY